MCICKCSDVKNGIGSVNFIRKKSQIYSTDFIKNIIQSIFNIQIGKQTRLKIHISLQLQYIRYTSNISFFMDTYQMTFQFITIRKNFSTIITFDIGIFFTVF